MQIIQPGPDNFLDLRDTPNTYFGQGGKAVSVKSTVDGLEFTTSSSSGFSVIEITGGTVDDSNMDFTFAQKPSLIVMNFQTLREGHGFTWDVPTLTATVFSPVGTGGDIYGLI